MNTEASTPATLYLLNSILLLTALNGCPAWAAKLRVNTLSDTLKAADGLCTLREAIANANEDIDTTLGDCAAGSEVDTITFRVSGTIMLASTLDITTGSSIILNGDGRNIIVSGGGTVRVMRVNGGAQLHLKRLTITKGFSFSSNDYVGGDGILNYGTLTVSNSTFTGNGHGPSSPSIGAGIYNAGILTVSNSTFSDNFAAVGGGIANEGTLTVSNSTFSGNDSIFSGGGIRNIAGTATVTGSTFSGNSTDSTGGGVANNDTFTIGNSTFSGNRAADGAGISNFGTLTVIHSTLSFNLGGPYVGGIRNFSGTLNLANTIVANNDRVDCENAGTLNISGVSLIGDGSCDASSDPAHFIIGSPDLGPLADNGGPTQTHALSAGSLAIDQADNTICAAAPVNNLDQRNQFRPVDGDGDGTAVCDIGAYEFVPPYPFSGFIPPLVNPPMANTVKAGRAVPIKLSLGGDYGLNIVSALYPKSQPVACESGAPLGDLEKTMTQGKNGLRYNPITNAYIYVWKTKRAWAGTCRKFIMKLIDNTEHVALFSFR
ncbi:PxKF domain-containing protein [Methylomicrobium agile]|uniref:PxKF domain-containing protein n=1 Tax=Methylomicrobium agile TaxID=39774 RepID=UPI00068D2CC6|nr:PxKF domain-containing protein [Methylomicrobium agile]